MGWAELIWKAGRGKFSEIVGLQDGCEDRNAGKFSRGMLQRVGDWPRRW